MKKSILKVSKFLVSASFMVLTACATASSPVGILYSDVYAPEGATSNPSGNRVGESCAMSIFGLVATGDASIETARRNGGITMISSVDNHVDSILGAYVKKCTIVRGK